MALPGWPDRYVRLIREALPQATLTLLCHDAEAISHSPNYWVPREVLEAGEAACRTPAELAICQLYQAHLRQQHQQQQLPPSWSGAEYWVQVYEPGKGLSFHFDKDESLLVSSGEMQHPLLSSIMYLTGAAEVEGSSREGPTVILEQLFDNASKAQVPEDPARAVLVYPQGGAYCLFDGRLGHGVLDSFSKGQRMTLLVNWWERQPEAVHALPEEEVEARGMTRLEKQQEQQQQEQQQQQQQEGSAESAPGSSIQAAAAAASSTAGQQPEVAGGGAAAVAAAAAPEDKTVAAASAATALEEAQQQVQSFSIACNGAAANSSWQGLQQAPGDEALPVLKYFCERGPVLIDTLAAMHGLRLTGEKASHLVALEHPGGTLYPLDDPEQYEALRGTRGEAVPQTAAALIPSSMLAGGSSSSSSSSDDDERGECS